MLPPIHELEVWLSRFTNRLLELQPQLGDSIALDTAKMLHPMLERERPEDAVAIFLQVMLNEHLRVGGHVPIDAPLRMHAANAHAHGEMRRRAGLDSLKLQRVQEVDAVRKPVDKSGYQPET